MRGRQIEGVKFRRQVPVGNFVADFGSIELKLLIELDGGQHSGSERDIERTKILEASGYTVLRFWNNDELGNIEGVHRVIVETIRSVRSPHPNPLPMGEGLSRHNETSRP